MTLQLDGEDLEKVKHFPAQKHNGDDHHQDGNGLSEIQAVAVGLKAAGDQAENIERGEAEDQRPQYVKYVALLAEIVQQEQGQELESESGLQPRQG